MDFSYILFFIPLNAMKHFLHILGLQIDVVNKIHTINLVPRLLRSRAVDPDSDLPDLDPGLV